MQFDYQTIKYNHTHITKNVITPQNQHLLCYYTSNNQTNIPICITFNLSISDIYIFSYITSLFYL